MSYRSQTTEPYRLSRERVVRGPRPSTTVLPRTSQCASGPWPTDGPPPLNHALGGSGDINAGWVGNSFGQWGYDYDAGAYGKPVTPLHNKGHNFAFADGHARWVNVENHPGWDLVQPQDIPDWPARQISFRIDYSPN